MFCWKIRCWEFCVDETFNHVGLSLHRVEKRDSIPVENIGSVETFLYRGITPIPFYRAPHLYADILLPLAAFIHTSLRIKRTENAVPFVRNSFLHFRAATYKHFHLSDIQFNCVNWKHFTPRRPPLVIL